jgi:hypothetical protein
MAALLSAVVGLILLASGAIKAVDSSTFARQLARYALIHPRFIRAAVVVLTALECALGAALLVHYQPPIVIPIAIAVLIALAALTAWASRQRQIDDCGCYGGVVVLSPVQSIAVDALYIAMLAVAWWLRAPAVHATRQPLTIGAIALIGGAGAWASREKPILDLSRLRKGKRWRRGWVSGAPYDLASGAHFVVFLSQECPWCKRWVPILNILGTQKDLPNVTGVMWVADEEVDKFRDTHLVRFPIARMKRKLSSSMVHAYPTAAMLQDGVIVDKWEGSMPEEYLTRVENFYRALEPVATAKRFAG